MKYTDRQIVDDETLTTKEVCELQRKAVFG